MSPDSKRPKYSIFGKNQLGGDQSMIMQNISSPKRKRNVSETKLKLMKILQDCELNMRRKAINDGKEIQKSTEEIKKSRYITLNKHLSFSIKRNDTICILGDDLNGAAGFFLGLVGDIDAIRCTDLTYSGSISYLNYKKSPLMFNCTLRDNILFGADLNTGKIEAITNSLKFSSFKNLQNFDFVIESPDVITVTERNLIFLARTLYCEKDLYIFHDVFHNIKSNLELEIFKIAVQGFLQDKSVIYNSNDTYCMKCSTRCWYMCQGAIRWRGEYSDINKDSKDILRSLLNNQTKSLRNVFQEKKTVLRTNVFTPGTLRYLSSMSLKTISENETSQSSPLKSRNIFETVKLKDVLNFNEEALKGAV